MESAKRKHTGIHPAGKKKFKTGLGKANIHGPGVYVTCVKGKERQTCREVLELFESLAETLWPQADPAQTGSRENTDNEGEEEEDIEKQIAKELQTLKAPPKRQKRFVDIKTDTPCLLFIACRPPVEVVSLVLSYLEEVAKTGIARTRFALRFDPVSVSCVASLAEVLSAAKKLIPTVFPKDPETPVSVLVKGIQFKVETRLRHHNKMKSKELIDQLAKYVPEGHKVSLGSPDQVILVTAFEVVAGISILPHYERLKRYSVAGLVGVNEFGEKAGENKLDRIQEKKNSGSLEGQGE